MTNSAGHTLQYLVSAGGDKAACEDRVGMFENVFWVLDGASLPPLLTNQIQPTTLWYVKTMGIELSNAVYASEPDASLVDILTMAISAINTRIERETAGDVQFLPSSTVVLVRVNGSDVEYLVLGDSFLVIDTLGAIECFSDQRISLVATDLRKTSRTCPEAAASDRIWADLVLAELAVRNKPNGYWIASDDPCAAKEAIVGRRQMAPGSRILAMTDGFADAHTVFGLYEDWSHLMRVAGEEGLSGILTHLRVAQASRLSQCASPGRRSSDDASALLIAWHE